MRVAALLVAALGVIGARADDTGDHWILNWATSVAMGRLDPIIAPGSVSAHVHNIVGASNFNSEPSNYTKTQDAKCSSIIVGADKSNYWSPQLFFIHANNTFQPILSATRIYYFTKSENVQPFPEGLRMISGLAISRNASAIESQGLAISCDHGDQTQWLPNGTSHPGGCSSISMGVYLPSCGNGSLDSLDHFSHMTWPVATGGGLSTIDINGELCPDSHPYKYPTVFAEFNYYLSDGQTWRANDVNLALATGDTTGLGFHLDFQNGWDNTVLADAIKECGYGVNIGDDLSKCAPFAPTLNQSAAFDCAFEGVIPDEDVGLYRPIAQLPGCNPLWTVDDNDEHQDCVDYDNPDWVGPTVFFENIAHGERLPMAFNLTSNYTTENLEQYTPSLGDTGASRLRQWGTFGSDSADVTVGTFAEVDADAADSTEENLTGATKATAHDFVNTLTLATSASGGVTEATTTYQATASATMSTVANAAVNIAAVSSSAASSTPSASPSATLSAPVEVVSGSDTAVADAASTTASKTCKRRKRGLKRSASNKARADIDAHRSRRSKRDMLNGHS